MWIKSLKVYSVYIYISLSLSPECSSFCSLLRVLHILLLRWHIKRAIKISLGFATWTTINTRVWWHLKAYIMWDSVMSPDLKRVNLQSLAILIYLTAYSEFMWFGLLWQKVPPPCIRNILITIPNSWASWVSTIFPPANVPFKSPPGIKICAALCRKSAARRRELTISPSLKRPATFTRLLDNRPEMDR